MGNRQSENDFWFAFLAIQHQQLTITDVERLAHHANYLSGENSFVEICRRENKLSADWCDTLENLAERHRADSAPGDTLTTKFPAAKPVVEIFAGSQDDPEATYLFESSSNAQPATQPATTDGELGRFTLLKPHAEGGLGTVHIALDQELNREVAVKQIQPRRLENQDSQTRFVFEATVTGALEHPGIVPVYGMGHDRQGHPFYAMQLIRGTSLKESIDVHFKLPSQQRVPSLRKLLQRFIAVCETVQFAHSRSIIHRDIKPSNIMLGEYGETLLVDWGLAKSLDASDEPAPHGRLQLSSTSGSMETQMGVAIGSAGYMPPEQATGKVELHGTASDVFSLGATLYHLLTGRVPFRGKDVSDTLKQVEKTQFPQPREVDRNIPASLESIVLKAMEHAPDQRYESPRALAEDIEKYLADEPVSVHTDTLLDRGSRWIRKNKSWAFASMLGLSCMVIAAFVSTVIIYQARVRVAQQKQRANQSEALAIQHYGDAKKNSQLAQDALDFFLRKFSEDRQMQSAALGPMRREMLLEAKRFYDQLAHIESDDPDLQVQRAQAYASLGRISEELGRAEEALELRLQQQSLLTKLVENHPSSRKYRMSLADCVNQLGGLYDRMGYAQKALTHCERAHQMAQTLVTENSDRETNVVFADSCSALGKLLVDSGEYDRGGQLLNQAISIQTKALESDDDDQELVLELCNSYQGLAQLLEELERFDGAEKAWSKIIDQLTPIGERGHSGPTEIYRVAMAHNGRGKVHRMCGRVNEAGKDINRAIDLLEGLLGRHHGVTEFEQSMAAAHLNLAQLFRNERRFEASLGPYKVVRDVYKTLAEREPNVPEYQYDLSVAWGYLAVVNDQLGQTEEAYAAWEENIRILRLLVQGKYQNDDYPYYLAVSFNNYGHRLNRSQRYDTAADYFAEATEMLSEDRQEHGKLLLSVAVGGGQASEKLARHSDALEYWKLAAELVPVDSNLAFARKVAVAYARCGRYAEAKTAAETLSTDQTRIQEYVPYYQACIYAMVYGIAQEDENLAEQEKSAEEYRLSALAALKQARDNGLYDEPNSRTKLEQSGELRSLFDDPDFKAFLQAIETQ